MIFDKILFVNELCKISKIVGLFPHSLIKVQFEILILELIEVILAAPF